MIFFFFFSFIFDFTRNLYDFVVNQYVKREKVKKKGKSYCMEKEREREKESNEIIFLVMHIPILPIVSLCECICTEKEIIEDALL